MSYQCHILTYAPGVDRQVILDALNAMPEAKNWRAAVGGVFIVTDANVTADTLGLTLAARVPNVNFVVAAISGMAQGRADKDTWEFLNTPKSL